MATVDDYIIRITERGAKEAANAIGGIGKESEKATGFVSGLNRAMFALGSVFSVKALLDYTDSWQSMTNQLKIVTKDAKELQQVQERLFKQAQTGRTDLGALTDLYQKLRMSQKEVGVSGENLFRVTDVISKSLAVAGKSGQAATNGLRQFVQGLVSGKLQGEELRSVLENTPYLAKTLADGLRVPVGALRELGAEGKLTAKDVVAALLRMEQAVNKDFNKTAVTISQAYTVLGNAITKFIGQSGEVSTASSIMANGILLIANNVDKLALSIAAAAGAWVAYRVAIVAVAAAQWLANAAIAANPIVRMAVIIAGVVAAMSALTGTTGEWVSLLKSMGETAVAAFKWIASGISTVSGLFSSLGTSVTESVTAITTGFTGAFDGLTSYLKSWYDWLVNLIGNQLPKSFSSMVTSVVNFFKEGFNTIRQVVIDVVEAISNTIKNFIDRALNWFNQLINAAKAAAREGVGSNNSSGNSQISGARAQGGSVLKGRTYLVGENGPELWTAERSGYIIPNGGSGGGSVIAANENRSTAKTLAAGFREALGEQFTELLDTTKSNNTLLQQIAENTKQLSETVKQSAASAAASETASGYSAINNFGIPTKETSSTSSATSSGGGSSLSSGGSSGSSSSSDPGNYSLDLIRRWAKEYASYINEYRGKPYGTGRYKNELEATYAANRWMNASVPGSAHSEVQSLAQTYYKATQSGAQVQFRSGGQIPAFATGGSFTVPGSTGVDSKLVNMRVSPGEQIDIRTRKQVREEREEWGNNGNTNNVTFNIQASDVDSFRRSEKQVRREMMRNLMKDAS